jgi:tRNA pseudouridine38-40 synthase
MTRWALLLEYDGTPFVGWQRQATGVSVQAILEGACARLNRGQTAPSIVAGRTDAGVHASGQVAHIELQTDYSSRALRDALNFHMKPYPVVVLEAARVEDHWSARFSATRRSYLYRILNRRSRPALDNGRVWHVAVPLNAEDMHEAAQCLVGRHDFTSFRATSCQANSPLRTLDCLDVARHDDIIEVTASARSFLHHQVRNFVGTLKQVGEGRWTSSHVRQILDARDRTKAGPTAPAEGLTLTDVGYPISPFSRLRPEQNRN